MNALATSDGEAAYRPQSDPTELDRYTDDGNPHTRRPAGDEPHALDPGITEYQPPAKETNPMTTNAPSSLLHVSVTNAPARPDSATSPDPKSRTRKRVLIALACPPALVAVSVCHTVLAVTYWIAFASTMNSLYLSVATSYSVVALISLWKVRETFQKDRRSFRKA